MNMDARFLGEEQCENVKEVASKFGMTVVCSDEDEVKEKADIIMPASETCENMKEVSSKFGVTVVCEE